MKRKFLFLSILGGVFLLASCYQYVLFPFDPNTGSNGEDYIWDGSTSDLSWYAENPNASTYSLSTPEEFAGLAALVRGGNSLAGKTITLANDIDLGGHNWTTIGTGNRSEMEDEDILVVDVGRYGFVKLQCYTSSYGFEELDTYTDSHSLFEGLWEEWLSLNVFLLAREMQLDDILYEDLFNNLPKEKQSELTGRKGYFAKKAGIIL